MGLAGAGWAEEDNVFGLEHEVELGQVHDEVLADRALEGELEVVQGLDRRKPGRADAGLTAGGLSGEDLCSSTAAR